MIKKLNENKLFLISIIGIMFIPILYSGFLIGAFTDPYSNLDKVKIAIINNDAGSDCNFKKMNVGKNLVSSLKNNNKFTWEFVKKKQAIKGMKNNRYYFSIEIPKTFSNDICEVLASTKDQADLIYIKNDNSNYIVGLIGKTLLSDLKQEVNNQIATNFLIDFDNKLAVGQDLANGSFIIKSELLNLKNGLHDLEKATNSLKENLASISTGSSSLSLATNDLSGSYTMFDVALKKTSSSLGILIRSNTEILNSMVSYETFLQTTINNSSLDTNTKNMVLNQYSSLVSGQLQINGSLSEVNGVLKTLGESSSKIMVGLNSVNQSNGNLAFNLNKLLDGSNLIYAGMLSSVNGSNKLLDGSSEINDGLNKFNDSIKALNITSNAKNISAPVKVTQKNYSEVANYGHGFAPYFMSLGLFVGGIASTVVISNRNKQIKKSKKDLIKSAGLYLFVAIIQALIMSLIVVTTQIEVTNLFGFVTFTILTSIAFMSIIQLLNILFNDIGKFLCIILLIFQLTASGGTFPIETTPKFFQLIHPFMPMTYTVDALRSLIGNGNISIVYNASLLMTLITLVSIVIMILYYKVSNFIDKKALNNC